MFQQRTAASGLYFLAAAPEKLRLIFCDLSGFISVKISAWEMGKQSLGLDPGKTTYLRSRADALVARRVESQSPHTDVELDMHPHRSPLFDRSARQLAGVIETIYRLDDIVSRKLARKAGRSVAQNKNRDAVAKTPKLLGLG